MGEQESRVQVFSHAILAVLVMLFLSRNGIES
jgi:hypothetical protein